MYSYFVSVTRRDGTSSRGLVYDLQTALDLFRHAVAQEKTRSVAIFDEGWNLVASYKAPPLQPADLGLKPPVGRGRGGSTP